MSYIITMGFLSWALVIMAWIGFGYIKFCDFSLRYDNDSDEVRMAMQQLIEEYNSRNVFGRLALSIWWGGRAISVLFISKGRDEDE